MDSDEVRDRWRGVAAWLDASPAEVAGLAVLLAGAATVVAVLWWTGRPVAVAPVALDPAVDEGPDGGHAAELVEAEDGTVTAHVAGAVAAPGLVELLAGARVADAVEAAGGFVLDADTERLNLARTLVDGERLDVPRLGEASPPQDSLAAEDDPDTEEGGAVRADGTLDLNLADAADLEELPGVGPVLATRILEWREANGPFTEVGQLRDVAGIGEKTFQSLAPLVGV